MRLLKIQHVSFYQQTYFHNTLWFIGSDLKKPKASGEHTNFPVGNYAVLLCSYASFFKYAFKVLFYFIFFNGNSCKLCFIIRNSIFNQCSAKSFKMNFLQTVQFKLFQTALSPNVPRDVTSQLGFIFERWLVCFEQRTLPWLIFDIY